MNSRTISLGEGQTLRIVNSSPDALELESIWTGDGQKPTRHYHPRQDERFEIVTGQLTVEIGAEPARVLRAGDTVDVPRGTVHRMWNSGPDTASALWRVAPRLHTDEMFKHIDQGLSPLRIATLLWRYRNEYRLRLRPWAERSSTDRSCGPRGGVGSCEVFAPGGAARGGSVDDSQVEAYLARIGAARPAATDAAALRELQVRHLHTVPFENLSIHLGEDITLTADALFGKIVTRRRGGFCYELNGAFAALLTALGYRVTLMAARVGTPDGLSPPFDHVALRVDLDEPWLVDVGFGRFSHFPLRLDVRTGQPEPGGVFRVVETVDGDLDVYRDDELEYRLEQRPRTLAECVPTCWFQQTSPDSHFTRSLVCSRLTDTGRITLSDRTIVDTANGQRTERVLETDESVLATYLDQFGIALDRLPPTPAPR